MANSRILAVALRPENRVTFSWKYCSASPGPNYSGLTRMVGSADDTLEVDSSAEKVRAKRSSLVRIDEHTAVVSG